jgi:tellurite resistance protein
MDLLDKVLANSHQVQEALSPAEAFVAISLAAIASDGYLSSEEARGISAALSRMKLFRSYQSDVMNAMFDKLLSILKLEGIDVLLSLAKESLPYELRPAAFAVATDLVLADGIIAQEERDFLKDLCQDLGIPTDLATQIVQVMLIKNQG